MNELTPNPSRSLKWGAIIAKWAVWLLAFAWITALLVWFALHFAIVPRIGEFRPWLEQQASKSLGVPVRIDGIAARSNGLIPSIELTGVRLLDAQGREALVLPSVMTALSLRSVLGLGFEQIYVDQPVLDVRRTADGKFWVAGIAVPSNDNPEDQSADWVFSQPELVIRHATVNWTDELRGAPPLALSDVDVVLRNGRRNHALRVDATPPAAWGQRMHLMAQFKQPLLSATSGQWREWNGQVYAEFGHVDLAQLRRYAHLGVDVGQGRGALRAWVDVEQGAIQAATADIALAAVNVRVDPRLEALTLASVSGRLGGKVLQGGFEFSTQALQFDTQDGLRWPGGNVRVATYTGDAVDSARGELSANRLDLAAMEQIASRLPLNDEVRATLKRLAPRGLVEQVQASWQGSIEKPSAYGLKGRVQQLGLSSAKVASMTTPGIKGADLDFDFNQSGGKASLALRNGAIDAAEVFDEPMLEFEQLTAEVQWKTQDQRLSVTVPSVRFANADGQGEFQLKWQAGSGKALGMLDLQGSASRLDSAHLYRYLPTQMDKEVRNYLKDALLGGTATGVKFRVKGDLDKFPFVTSKQGEFHISGKVQNATYAFAPASIMPKESLPWPALTQLGGELSIDNDVMLVKVARGGIAGSPGMQITKAEATIRSLYKGAVLTVLADAKGPLSEALAAVNATPIAGWTDNVLARANAGGAADLRLKLAFPLLNIDSAKVQGTVTLQDNNFQLAPDVPRLVRARGVVSFTESGFSVAGGQARALGGDVRIDGGLTVAGPTGGNAGSAGHTSATVLRFSGTATAEGLRAAKELALPARLARYASGSTTYSGTVGLRGGVPELMITSNLAGMGLTLPAPFAKTEPATLPLRVEASALRSATKAGAAGAVFSQDQLKLEVGRVASVVYVRDISGAEPRVLRGAIGVGLAADESAPMPESGVVANVNMESLDVDAWNQVFAAAPGTATTGVNPVLAYLPNSLAVRTGELVVAGRKLSNVVVGGTRDGYLWRANVEAPEISGYIEYRQPTGNNAGRLYARLVRMVIGPNTAKDVETLLDEQPISIPALDVVVDDLDLRGKKLGRVDLEAVNRGGGATREWRLNRFNITTPEAVLTASGNWANVAAANAPASRNIKDRRRTALNFKLAINDAGEVLDRFGMKEVVRKGRGKIEGQLAWAGSPITLDYPSLSGSFNVNVEEGQFLKADPGIAKLLGVLSLQSLPRRLVLDFRDVFSEGFAFDLLRGDVTIDAGIARTNNLQMKGVNAAVLMEGQADIAKETQTLKVVVVPEINAGSASLLASAINPVVGLTTFLAQWVLRRPLMEANTQEFLVDGTWVDPRVTKVERGAATAAPAAKPEPTK